MPLLELNLQPQRSHLRTFGLACCLLAGVFAALRWQAAPRFAIGLATLAAIAGIVAMVVPRLLRWPFIIAMIIAWPIGFVVSWVLLAVVYYGVFTPIGLVRRRFGGLELKLDRSAGTYWRPRPAARNAKSYFRQY